MPEKNIGNLAAYRRAETSSQYVKQPDKTAHRGGAFNRKVLAGNEDVCHIKRKPCGDKPLSDHRACIDKRKGPEMRIQNHAERPALVAIGFLQVRRR